MSTDVNVPEWKEKPDQVGDWIICLRTITSDDWSRTVCFCNERVLEVYAIQDLTPGLVMRCYGPIPPLTTQEDHE